MTHPFYKTDNPMKATRFTQMDLEEIVKHREEMASAMEKWKNNFRHVPRRPA